VQDYGVRTAVRKIVWTLFAQWAGKVFVVGYRAFVSFVIVVSVVFFQTHVVEHYWVGIHGCWSKELLWGQNATFDIIFNFTG
jgi:hypothetical protein